MRVERLSPLSGIAGAVLLVAGALLLGIWDYLPSAERLGEHLAENEARVWIGGYLGVVASFFVIWFAGSLYRVLREREGGTGWLSTISLGGGVAGAALLAIGFSVILTSAARAGSALGISDIEAVVLYDVYSLLGQGFAACAAAFIAGAAAVSLRTALLPAWAGWAGVIIAVGLLTPIAYLVLAAMLVWVAAMSAWLYLRPPAAV